MRTLKHGKQYDLKSAKYRATQLIDCLLNCVKLSNERMNNPKEDSRTRLEAAKTACLSYANVVKILENGPTFKLSLPIYPKNKNPELTDIDTN